MIILIQPVSARKWKTKLTWYRHEKDGRDDICRHHTVGSGSVKPKRCCEPCRKWWACRNDRCSFQLLNKRLEGDRCAMNAVKWRHEIRAALPTLSCSEKRPISCPNERRNAIWPSTCPTSVFRARHDWATRQVALQSPSTPSRVSKRGRHPLSSRRHRHERRCYSIPSLVIYKYNPLSFVCVHAMIWYYYCFITFLWLLWEVRPCIHSCRLANLQTRRCVNHPESRVHCLPGNYIDTDGKCHPEPFEKKKTKQKQISFFLFFCQLNDEYRNL